MHPGKRQCAQDTQKMHFFKSGELAHKATIRTHVAKVFFFLSTDLLHLFHLFFPLQWSFIFLQWSAFVGGGSCFRQEGTTYQSIQRCGRANSGCRRRWPLESVRRWGPSWATGCGCVAMSPLFLLTRTSNGIIWKQTFMCGNVSPIFFEQPRE